jgi:hypothetical protein
MNNISFIRYVENWKNLYTSVQTRSDGQVWILFETVDLQPVLATSISNLRDSLVKNEGSWRLKLLGSQVDIDFECESLEDINILKSHILHSSDGS